MALEGRCWVRAWHDDDVRVFELEPRRRLLPAGRQRATSTATRAATTARAICGVAPSCLP